VTPITTVIFGELRGWLAEQTRVLFSDHTGKSFDHAMVHRIATQIIQSMRFFAAGIFFHLCGVASLAVVWRNDDMNRKIEMCESVFMRCRITAMALIASHRYVGKVFDYFGSGHTFCQRRLGQCLFGCNLAMPAVKPILDNARCDATVALDTTSCLFTQGNSRLILLGAQGKTAAQGKKE
jgi:hypothetical protein